MLKLIMNIDILCANNAPWGKSDHIYCDAVYCVLINYCLCSLQKLMKFVNFILLSEKVSVKISGSYVCMHILYVVRKSIKHVYKHWMNIQIFTYRIWLIPYVHKCMILSSANRVLQAYFIISMITSTTVNNHKVILQRLQNYMKRMSR